MNAPAFPGSVLRHHPCHWFHKLMQGLFSRSLDTIRARARLHHLTMLCEDCHQNEAAYRLTAKKDGVRTAKVLCEDCAQQYRPELSRLFEAEQFELLHKLDDE